MAADGSRTVSVLLPRLKRTKVKYILESVTTKSDRLVFFLLMLNILVSVLCEYVESPATDQPVKGSVALTLVCIVRLVLSQVKNN